MIALLTGIFLIFIVFFLLLPIILRGAPFVPSGRKTVRQMVEISDIKEGQKAADLGSGDGRIVIAFAKAGAKESHGYEINPFLVLLARRNIKKEGLSDKAFIHWGSFWRYNFSSFNVVTLYGIDYIMKGLEKKLGRELKKGAKVVSNTFVFSNWPHSRKNGDVYVYIKQ